MCFSEKPEGTAPEFVQPLKVVEVVEGEPARLECRVTGLPSPNITWLKDEKVIVESIRVKTSMEGELCFLLIPETTLDDEGEFKCEARNDFGKATTMSELLVNEPAEEEIPPTFSPLVGQGPLELTATGDLTLEVGVTGQPEPTVQWLIGNKPLPKSEKYVLESKEDTHKLTIKEAGPGDTGSYVVKAENPAGTNTRTFNVDISGKTTFGYL